MKLIFSYRLMKPFQFFWSYADSERCGPLFSTRTFSTPFSLFVLLFQGGFCSRIQYHHYLRRYCLYRTWTGCVYYGYHIVEVPEVVMECCSGFSGTDCTTPICTTSCEPGYSCTSPDECTPNTTFIDTTYTPISTSTMVNEITTATTEPSEIVN